MNATSRPREVVITGAGRGIGRAIALRFAEGGARVFINFFVNREAAEKTARDVELAGGSAHLVQADLKEPAKRPTGPTGPDPGTMPSVGQPGPGGFPVRP